MFMPELAFEETADLLEPCGTSRLTSSHGDQQAATEVVGKANSS
jgi:hypothetical protein